MAETLRYRLVLLPLLLMLCLSSVIVSAEAAPSNAILRVTYSVCGDGSVIISAWANTTDLLLCAIPVQGNVLRDTVLAWDPEGTPLDFKFNGTHIVVATANASSVYVRYAADGLVSVNEDGSFTFSMKTLAPADIILPEGAALVDLEPQPQRIDFKGERILLSYPAGVNVKVTYMLIPMPTTATATVLPSPSVTTTATTTVTTTSPSPTPAAPVVTTTPTVSPALTTTPPPPTASPEKTASAPGPGLGGTALLGAAIAVAAVAAASIALIVKKRSASSGSVQVVFSSPGELDDRDRLILDTLKSKGPMSLSELSRATGISKSTLWRRVQRLKKMGYIVEERVGNKSLLKLSEQR